MCLQIILWAFSCLHGSQKVRIGWDTWLNMIQQQSWGFCRTVYNVPLSIWCVKFCNSVYDRNDSLGSVKRKQVLFRWNRIFFLFSYLMRLFPLQHEYFHQCRIQNFQTTAFIFTFFKKRRGICFLFLVQMYSHYQLVSTYPSQINLRNASLIHSNRLIRASCWDHASNHTEILLQLPIVSCLLDL